MISPISHRYINKSPSVDKSMNFLKPFCRKNQPMAIPAIPPRRFNLVDAASASWSKLLYSWQNGDLMVI
jgi:hypothetical protein